MKKIYCFECINNSNAITVDEFQTDPETVILKVHNGDDILLLPFTKDEFHELCNIEPRGGARGNRAKRRDFPTGKNWTGARAYKADRKDCFVNA